MSRSAGEQDVLDLTGTWHGIYSYPGDEGPPTPFLAIILDRAGSITGTIVEPDQFYGQGTLDAAIAGVRAGTSVDFIKTYNDSLSGYDNPVDYVGRLSDDGQTVSGIWSLLDRDGSFEMERETEIEEPVAAEEAEELPQNRH